MNPATRLITLAEPYSAEHTYQKNSIEAELSGIITILRVIEKDILSNPELDFTDELAEYEARIRELTGTYN